VKKVIHLYGALFYSKTRLSNETERFSGKALLHFFICLAVQIINNRLSTGFLMSVRSPSPLLSIRYSARKMKNTWRRAHGDEVLP